MRGKSTVRVLKLQRATPPSLSESHNVLAVTDIPNGVSAAFTTDAFLFCLSYLAFTNCMYNERAHTKNKLVITATPYISILLLCATIAYM